MEKERAQQSQSDQAFLQSHAANVAAAMGADYVPPFKGTDERRLLQEARAFSASFKPASARAGPSAALEPV